jgi:hypothetical protein
VYWSPGPFRNTITSLYIIAVRVNEPVSEKIIAVLGVSDISQAEGTGWHSYRWFIDPGTISPGIYDLILSNRNLVEGRQRGYVEVVSKSIKLLPGT